MNKIMKARTPRKGDPIPRIPPTPLIPPDPPYPSYPSLSLKAS